MRILHLSDFHYKSTEKDIASQDILLEKLLEHLSPDLKINYFLFTGDLVFSGANLQDFDSAYDSLLKKIGEKLDLPKKNGFICAGNHDVNRKMISEPIKQFIREFKNSEQLTKIVEDNKDDVFGLSCKPILNFKEFQNKFYSKTILNNLDEVKDLYSVHIRHLDGVKIGFVTINTAWCSSGDDDKGNLFWKDQNYQ